MYTLQESQKGPNPMSWRRNIAAVAVAVAYSPHPTRCYFVSATWSKRSKRSICFLLSFVAPLHSPNVWDWRMECRIAPEVAAPRTL